MICIISGILYQTSSYNNKLYKSTEERYQMLVSADKLRQSSDDLTHFARTYVVTGDDKFKKQYLDTLSIRNGEKSRPFNYNSIYWDLKKEEREKSHPNSENISLKKIMEQLPFTIDELKLLKLSEFNSNDLVNLEIEAFNAMDGKYKDENNKYTIVKKSNQDLAIELLHSREYYNAKHNIMKPIDDFLQLLDERTQKEVYSLQSIINTTFNIFLFTLFVFIIGNIFIYNYLNIKDKRIDTEKSNLLKNLENKNLKLEEQSKILTQTHRELEESEYELEEINKNLKQKIILEVEKNINTQKQLFKSEKMASMGEMIGNIAHQWRQPLSVISTGATGMKMQKEFGSLSDDQFNKTCDAINDNAQYLSKTIDDFRNFIQGDRNKKIFNLEDDITSFLHLIEGSVKSHNINIILDLDETIQIDGYENELSQCFINIFNNAKDAFLENKTKNKTIFISSSIENDKAIIKIKDNAGGIQEDILPRIFEPYFTTKHQSQGTGLGLHMTYNLIVDGMSGTVEAHNVNYEYDDKNYTGAEFIISLPMS